MTRPITPSADDAALVERLERLFPDHETGQWELVNPDGPKAAARILALSQPVPSEPTKAMIETGAKAIDVIQGGLNYDYKDFCRDAADAAYRAMITARENSDGK